MNRILATVVLALGAVANLGAQGLPVGRPEALGLDAARLARIDRVMQQYVDSGQAAGIVTLVARQGRVVHLGTYGMADREAARPMTGDALFRIASQTKAITSVAVMMLVEEGRLRLSDPVARWLPGFAEMQVATRADSGTVLAPARRPVTIRQLLTHTAGLSYGTEAHVAERYRAAGLGPAAGYGWYLADKTEPVCVSMDRLGDLPLVAQPGERYVYGYATDVLGCVVERVAGQPLDVVLRTRLFAPLRMRDTHFFVPAADRTRLAAVYAGAPGRTVTRADDGPRGQGAYVDGPRTTFAGGAGLVATVGDYARFLQMLLNGGQLDGVRVLSPATVALMTADHIDALYDAPGLGFGLGFQVLEDPGLAAMYGSRGAYGWGGAYATTYWVDPAEQLVALLFAQVLPAGDFDGGARFRQLVYQAIVAPPARGR